MKNSIRTIFFIAGLLAFGYSSATLAAFEITQLSNATTSAESIHYIAGNGAGDIVFSRNGSGTYFYNGLDQTVTESLIDNGRGYIPSLNNHGEFTYDSDANGNTNMLYQADTGTSISVNALTGLPEIGVGSTMVNDNGDLGILVGRTWPSFGVGFYNNTTGVYTDLSLPSYAGFPEDMNNNGDVIWTTWSGTHLYDNDSGTISVIAPFTSGYAWGPYSYANINDSQDVAFSDRAQRHYWTHANGNQSYTWVWTANIYVAATGEIVFLDECGSGGTPVLNNNGQAVFLVEDIRNKYAFIYGNGEVTSYVPDEIVIYDLATGVSKQITDNSAGLSFDTMNHEVQTPINVRGDVAFVGHDPANPDNHTLMVYTASDRKTRTVLTTVDTRVDKLHLNDNGELFWVQIDKVEPYLQQVFKATYIHTVEDIIGMVDDLRNSGDITNEHTDNQLTKKLEKVQTALDKGNLKRATSKINAFIKFVNAKRGKTISNEGADKLIEAAQLLLANI